jgi:hypothetical protein
VYDDEPQIFEVIDAFWKPLQQESEMKSVESAKSEEKEPALSQKVESLSLQNLEEEKGEEISLSDFFKGWCEAYKEPLESLSIHHLIWEMLRFNPAERIIVDQALAKVKKMMEKVS